MGYDYPIDYTWSTEEIITVMALYNAVEKAYEEGIEKVEFMSAYRGFKTIIQSMSQEKQIDKQFLEASGYSIYKVKKALEENDFIKV